MPGYKSGRIVCAQCGEGINYDREVRRDGLILCQGCADPENRYYRDQGLGLRDERDTGNP
jgi:formylmethanofuran dehydrogenase subunit E